MSTSRDHAQLTAAALSSAGVDRAFGMPGGGANLELIDAGAAAGIPFVLMHGETAACIAASTYGLLRGSVGAAVVTRGPGLASAINGVAHATLDRQPLVLLSDLVTASAAERVTHQRLDQLAITRPVTRASITVGTRDTGTTVAAALRVAAGPPAGAVHLDLDPTVEGDRPPVLDQAPALDDAAVEAAAALIASARRPVFVVGPGVRGAEDRLRAAAESIGAPVLTTYQAKGSVPEDAGYAAGVFTNGALERPLVDRADILVAVGIGDANELPPTGWPYDLPVVAMDRVPADNRYMPVTVRVDGDLGTSLDTLAEAVLDERGDRDTDWEPDAGQRHRLAAVDLLMASAASASGLSPQEALRIVEDHSGGSAVLTVDSGVHLLVAMGTWTARGPYEILISRGLATMGYALPAALGASLAGDDAEVICLVGDGGLGMVMSELETLRRMRAKVTVVVFNDDQLTMIALKQPPGAGGGPAAVRYDEIDFARVAEGCDVPAWRATTGAQLQDALAVPVDGPKLIDVRIDAEPYAEIMRVSRGG